MLVKRTSKNQFTLPKALLKAAGIGKGDEYFDAVYDQRKHVISLKPVKVVVEETISPKAVERMEKEAFTIRPGDKVFESWETADAYLRSRIKK